MVTNFPFANFSVTTVCTVFKKDLIYTHFNLSIYAFSKFIILFFIGLSKFL